MPALSYPNTTGPSGEGSRVERAKSQAHSKITNGTRLLGPEVDGRNVWVRRCKDLIRLHVADLGGEANCSAAERSIIRRASVLTVELERLEAKFANAGQATADDLDLYSRTAGNLRRLFEAIGLQRRARDISPPSVAAYLEHINNNEAPPG
jgi:hypothetical protein